MSMKSVRVVWWHCRLVQS